MDWTLDDPLIQHCVVGLEAVAVDFLCVQDVLGLGKEPWNLRRRDKDFAALECREYTVQAMLRELGGRLVRFRAWHVTWKTVSTL